MVEVVVDTPECRPLKHNHTATLNNPLGYAGLNGFFHIENGMTLTIPKPFHNVSVPKYHYTLVTLPAGPQRGGSITNTTPW